MIKIIFYDSKSEWHYVLPPLWGSGKGYPGSGLSIQIGNQMKIQQQEPVF